MTRLPFRCLLFIGITCAGCHVPVVTTPHSVLAKTGATNAPALVADLPTAPGPVTPSPSGTPALPGLDRPAPSPVPSASSTPTVAASAATQDFTVRGVVQLPATLIANNGGNILTENGAGYRLTALEEAPLAGAQVSMLDAAGVAVTGPDGKPLVTTTDAQGRYGFSAPLPDRNLVVSVALAQGAVRAIAPRGTVVRQADANLVSTLTTAYIEARYVQVQADPVATLDKLPADVEAATRDKARAALEGNATAVPDALTPSKVVAAVDQLRRSDAAFDSQMETVRKLLVVGSTSAVTSDGPALDAQLYLPNGLTVDAAGNVLIADTFNSLVRRLTPDGRIGTVAGTGDRGAANGPGASATFFLTTAVAVDDAGTIYVCDQQNKLIRKIASNGAVSTLAGGGGSSPKDGVGTAAAFDSPNALYWDPAGTLYVGDGNMIRKVTPDGSVTTLAGGSASGYVDAVGTAARFNRVAGLVADRQGNLLAADYLNHVIRKVAPSGAVTTYAGLQSATGGLLNGPAASAAFRGPSGIALDAAGNLYVGEMGNHLIREVTPAGVVTTLAGNGREDSSDGPGATAGINQPSGLALDASGNLLATDNVAGLIRKIDLHDPAHPVTTIAGTGKQRSHDGTTGTALFSQPQAAAFSRDGVMYVADGSNHTIRKVAPDGTVSTLAGSGKAGFADGQGAAASFNFPHGLAVDAAGNVFVVDYWNNAIRKVTPDGTVTTLAGSGAAGMADGIGRAASFNRPSKLAVDSHGNVFVVDFNTKVRRITPDGNVTTITSSLVGAYDILIDQDEIFISDQPAGYGIARLGLDGSLTQLPLQADKIKDLSGFARDAAGNFYAADLVSATVLRVAPDGTVTPLPVDGLKQPDGLAIDPSGRLFVVDQIGNQVLQVPLP